MTEQIDKLYLELSQFTSAKTSRELELERALEAACHDLVEAHTELMKAQGIESDEAMRLDWPEWSGPANTLRWSGRLLGKHLGKSDVTAPDSKK